MSIDALRGFTMFWIIGADDLVHAVRNLQASGVLKNLGRQLQHKTWEGFTFYDLIFPLFLFIVGISIALALPRLLAREGRAAACRHILWRTLILFALGLFYNGGVSDGFYDMRYLGVLQRTAVCYGLASLAFMTLRPRAIVGWIVGSLLAYWALLALMPVPGYGPPSFERAVNLVDWFDQRYLPGGLFAIDHDPEGVLSTLPAISSCLLGVLAGCLLKSPALPESRKLVLLAGGGVLLVGLGFFWGLWFPVIKELWTSSFVLVAGGYSCVLLALFYWVIEVRGFRRWAQPFVWLGLNSILIYLVTNVVSFKTMAQRFVGGDIDDYLDDHFLDGSGDLLIAVVALALSIILVYVLHRQKIYLKV